VEKTIVSWSGGKDSAYALYKIMESNQLQISGLLTIISDKFRRSSMHGIRSELIQLQTDVLGIPLKKVALPEDCSNRDYAEIMTKTLEEYKNQGIKSMVFADIFLEDVRKYREENLKTAGFKGHWPLWKQESSKIARKFLIEGFKAITVCVDGEKLDRSFVGRKLDHKFLNELPQDVDPCGENGEYHTFVWDGPIFDHPIQVEKGEVIQRKIGDKTFYYCDIFEKSYN
jgi:uncharacterized protein (TIGR00290 family)